MKKLMLLAVLALSRAASAQDVTSPTIICPEDVTLAAGAECTASYDGPAATATDDQDPTPTIGPELPLALGGPGQYVVTHTATDDAGNTASCDQTVTVVDATPPVVGSAEATPACLWPPNHRMVAFRPGEGLAVEATDNCDLSPAFTYSATSSEADDGRGDGHTAPDFVAGDEGFCVRSERSGGGGGRVYSVEVRAVDAAGNASTDAVFMEIRVPHDQHEHDCPALGAFADDSVCGMSGDGGVAGDGGDGSDAAEMSGAACSLSQTGRAAPGGALLLGLLLARRRRQCTGRPGTK